MRLSNVRLRRSAYLLAVVGAGLTAQRLGAQDPYVRVTEPSEWRDNKALSGQPGRAIRISGVAFHPAGVREILVNGAAAMLEPDAPLMNFTYTLTPDARMRRVTITLV